MGWESFLADRLEYFVSEKNGVVVVSFLGIITQETVEIINEVLEEVQGRSPKLLIVNCHDLLDMDEKCVTALAQFNEFVRGMPSALSYCFVHPTVRKLLVAAGTIAEEDIKNNFIEALDCMKDGGKQAA